MTGRKDVGKAAKPAVCKSGGKCRKECRGGQCGCDGDDVAFAAARIVEKALKSFIGEKAAGSVADVIVGRYGKLLVEASGYDFSGASVYASAASGFGDGDSVDVEFKFFRKEGFGESGSQEFVESFVTTVYPRDKERSVAEFDALVGEMVLFDFPKKAPCHAGPAEAAPETAPKKVPADPKKFDPPKAEDMKKGLLAGSSYDIPKSRLNVSFSKVDRKHGNYVYLLRFYSKAPKAGRDASCEQVTLNAKISGDTAAKMVARFDKAVSALKTVKFSKRK